MIPRIRGKVGQATEPEEVKGKWFFELFLTQLGAGDLADESLGLFGPWNSEKIAQTELRRAAQLACEVYEKHVSGKVSGKYIDMKTNLLKYWDGRNEN